MSSYNNHDEQPNIIKEQAKKQIKKHAGKALKKVGKHLGKAALNVGRLALLGLKPFIVMLLSLSAPVLLLLGFSIFLILIVFFSVSMIFGGNHELDGEAGEFKNYITQQANLTVNLEDPKQIPYRVPEGLIAAVMQLYTSVDTGETYEEAVEVIADKLRPVFNYETETGYVETYTTTCDDEGCETDYDTFEFDVELLTHVTAWNGEMTAEIIPVTGDWETYKPSKRKTVRSRVHYYVTEETLVEDYTYYEAVLMDDPFNYGEMDLEFIETLFLATGGSMNYTAMKKGLTLSDYGLYLNVIPGESVPAEYMPYYLAAQQKYGIDWFYLAAIHYVETGFSTHPTMISSVGAEGHTQWMPCTWHGWDYPGCDGTNGYVEIPKTQKYQPYIIERYGGYGVDANGNGIASPWEIEDAIHSTAYLLTKNGFKRNVDRALFAYNHSETYVLDVKEKAREFREAAIYEAGRTDGAVGQAPPPDLKNGFVQPTLGRITSSWGGRYINGVPDFHAALDIANKEGTPVVAIADGVIKRVGQNCPTVGFYGSECNYGWGNYLWITHTVNGETYDAVYAHFSVLLTTKVGAQVKQGQMIGLMGTSGSSTGPHLHIELHRGYRDKYKNVVNPLLYIPFKT